MTTMNALDAVIMDRLIEAYVTMRRLHVHGYRPSQTTTWWPETVTPAEDSFPVQVQRLKLGLKAIDAPRGRPAPPTSAQISRMEEVWNWAATIKSDSARKAVATKVECWVTRRSSASVARDMGVDRKTLNRRFNKGVEDLMRHLCKEGGSIDLADEFLVSRFRPNQGIKDRKIGSNAA